MSSAPEAGRSHSCYIWLLSCFFFLELLAGGTLLALYVALPESESQAWFPFAGMILVAIPWLFWIFTWVYRSISTPRAADIERPPVRAAPTPTPAPAPAVSSTAPVATTADAGDSTAPTESTANNDSSLKSNESERPLALSMS